MLTLKHDLSLFESQAEDKHFMEGQFERLSWRTTITRQGRTFQGKRWNTNQRPNIFCQLLERSFSTFLTKEIVCTRYLHFLKSIKVFFFLIQYYFVSVILLPQWASAQWLCLNLAVSIVLHPICGCLLIQCKIIKHQCLCELWAVEGILLYFAHLNI